MAFSLENPVPPTATVPGDIHASTQVSPYQALDNFQQFLHDYGDALVAQQSADGLEVRGPHKVPVGAIDVAVGNVERLKTEFERK